MADGPTSLAALFERAGVRYAVIGAHAVNVWVEPRATADIDVTVLAAPKEQRRLREIFEAEGYRVEREYGVALPSGPDFVRFVSDDRVLTVEVQAAKTELQRELVGRALPTETGLLVATPEDLVVLKLIAYRPKDRIDLLGLVNVPRLDWSYIERWAREWEVLDRLAETRAQSRT